MKIFVPVFIGSLVLTACGGAPPKPLTPAQSQRATARAAVTVAASAFVLAANACLAASQADPVNHAAIAKTCVKYLDPAHDLIVEAAQAVDSTWSPKAACDLSQAVTLATTAMTTLGLNTASLAPVLQDAAMLALALAGTNCAPADAGAE
jgi:hypothetical protein